MKTNLNQIRKEYNNSISEIPEERLKELLYNLLYQMDYQLFVEEDKEAHIKTHNTLMSLVSNIDQPKLFRAGKRAVIEAPVMVMMDLYNKNKRETRELINELFKMYLLFMGGENDLLNLFIEIIEEIEDGNQSLEFLKRQIVKVRDKTTDLLKIHKNDLDRTIQYYESKKDLSQFEMDGLEELKEIRGGLLDNGYFK